MNHVWFLGIFKGCEVSNNVHIHGIFLNFMMNILGTYQIRFQNKLLVFFVLFKNIFLYYETLNWTLAFITPHFIVEYRYTPLGKRPL